MAGTKLKTTNPRRESQVIVKYLTLATSKPIRFLQALERLCKDYAGDRYQVKYDVED